MPIDKSGSFKKGLKTTQRLNSIDIFHIDDVVQIGVIEVCMRLRQVGYPVTLNMAYGLQGDIMGISWNKVPEEIKKSLSEQFNKHKIRPTR